MLHASSLGLHGCFGPLEGTGDPRNTPCPTCRLQFLQCMGPLGVHAEPTAFWHRDTSPLADRVWAGCRLSKEHHPSEPFSRTGFSPPVGTSAEVLQFSIESLHSRECGCCRWAQGLGVLGALGMAFVERASSTAMTRGKWGELGHSCASGGGEGGMVACIFFPSQKSGTCQEKNEAYFPSRLGGRSGSVTAMENGRD